MPLRTAKRLETARLAAKTALLDILKISAKTGCGRGVPGGLRRNDKIGDFSRQTGTAAAKSGGYAGEFR
jgi:hypothetical protein